MNPFISVTKNKRLRTTKDIKPRQSSDVYIILPTKDLLKYLVIETLVKRPSNEELL